MGFIDAKLNNPDLKERDREYINQARDNVNTLFFKIADCADIGRIVEDMVTANPDDMDLKIRLLKVLNGKDCTEEAIYLPLAKAVHAASPTSESAFSLAMSLVKDRDLNRCLEVHERSRGPLRWLPGQGEVPAEGRSGGQCER